MVRVAFPRSMVLIKASMSSTTYSVSPRIRTRCWASSRACSLARSFCHHTMIMHVTNVACDAPASRRARRSKSRRSSQAPVHQHVITHYDAMRTCVNVAMLPAVDHLKYVLSRKQIQAGRGAMTHHGVRLATLSQHWTMMTQYYQTTHPSLSIGKARGAAAREHIRH